MSFSVDEVDCVYVCWEDFFELARDPKNWTKEIAPMLTCGFIDSHIDAIPAEEGPRIVYTFDTVDRDFRHEFSLCEDCVENCAEYVDWWLETMAEDHYLPEYATNVLLVDITNLGEEAQARYNRLRQHKMATT